MYKHILVAIDGSETSNKALQEAITLAKETHATLRLCHVIDLTVIYSDLDAPFLFGSQGALEAARRKVIEDATATARAAGIEFDSKTIVLDRPGEHIYEAGRSRGESLAGGPHCGRHSRAPRDQTAVPRKRRRGHHPGREGCSSHSGRRTFITRAARLVHKAGGSLRDVQLLAGHRSIQTTQRYIDGDSDAQRKLVSLI